MDTQAVLTALVAALKRLLTKYKDRYDKNNGTAHKQLTLQQVLALVGPSTAVGAAVGTVVPGLGNAVGAVAGLGGGALVAGAMELNNMRNNRKLDHTATVLQALGGRNNVNEQNSVLDEAAQVVVAQRADLLTHLRDTPQNTESVAAYLAANMMAALKHRPNDGRSRADVMAEGLAETLSKKVASRNLDTLDGAKVSLKEVAHNRLRM